MWKKTWFGIHSLVRKNPSALVTCYANPHHPKLGSSAGSAKRKIGWMPLIQKGACTFQGEIKGLEARHYEQVLTSLQMSSPTNAKVAYHTSYSLTPEVYNVWESGQDIVEIWPWHNVMSMLFGSEGSNNRIGRWEFSGPALPDDTPARQVWNIWEDLLLILQLNVIRIELCVWLHTLHDLVNGRA